MKLNYQVFTNEGHVFMIPASNDAEARNLILDYLKETKGQSATIIPWNSETEDYDGKRKFEVEIEETPKPREIEYKLETRYVKWVRGSGVMKEKEFRRRACAAAESLDTLPEQSGWTRSFRAELVHFTDDERYGAKNIEEIKIQ